MITVTSKLSFCILSRIIHHFLTICVCVCVCICTEIIYVAKSAWFPQGKYPVIAQFKNKSYVTRDFYYFYVLKKSWGNTTMTVNPKLYLHIRFIYFFMSYNNDLRSKIVCVIHMILVRDRDRNTNDARLINEYLCDRKLFHRWHAGNWNATSPIPRDEPFIFSLYCFRQ